MFTIVPREAASAGAARCDRKYGARTLIANIVSQSDCVVSPTGVRTMIAAEFTSAPRAPCHATARSTSASASASPARSACSTMACPPPSRMSLAVSSAPSRDPLKWTTTRMPRAPRASAIARPTRRPAPVTSATRPASGSPPSGGRGTAARIDSLVLAAEPLEGHLHHADRTRAVGRTVPIGTTAGDEPELVYAGAEPGDVVWRVARMLDLHPVEAHGDERLDALASARRSRMGKHREAAGSVNHRDGLAHPELVLGDIGRTTRSQIAVERVAHVRRPAVGDERSCDVRAPDGTRAGLQQHIVERDLDALRLE